MKVIPLDQRRRRQNLRIKTEAGPATILPLDRLADGVLLRVMRRQAHREMEQIHYLYRVTGGDPTMLPTLEQMGEIVDGTIEF